MTGGTIAGVYHQFHGLERRGVDVAQEMFDIVGQAIHLTELAVSGDWSEVVGLRQGLDGLETAIATDGAGATPY
ncbi:hypothetical protein D3C78_589360 [compost metagenome]